jgi:putative ABC transport system ATP-binding protein
VSESRPVLELEAVQKIYGLGDAAVHVLKGIDLRVDEGEYVAIIGPSGSGKSTILNILGCLDRPSHGACRIAGDDVAKMDDKQLSRIRNTRIGFIFQSFHLISHLTVIENVELPLFYARMGRAERHARCTEMLDKVGLGHRLTHIPNQLSGGERQRVAVARALSNDPALVLADEPTGNLDSKTSAEIMELLYELHRGGTTIVLITHDPEIAAAAPRRVMLRDGLVESDVRDAGGSIALASLASASAANASALAAAEPLADGAAGDA